MASEKNLQSIFSDIANAIREKTKTTDKIKSYDMAEKINDIKSGITFESLDSYPEDFSTLDTNKCYVGYEKEFEFYIIESGGIMVPVNYYMYILSGKMFLTKKVNNFDEIDVSEDGIYYIEGASYLYVCYNGSLESLPISDTLDKGTVYPIYGSFNRWMLLYETIFGENFKRVYMYTSLNSDSGLPSFNATYTFSRMLFGDIYNIVLSEYYFTKEQLTNEKYPINTVYVYKDVENNTCKFYLKTASGVNEVTNLEEPQTQIFINGPWYYTKDDVLNAISNSESFITTISFNKSESSYGWNAYQYKDEDIIPENIKNNVTINGVIGNLKSDSYYHITKNIKTVASTSDILSGETDKLYILNNQNNLKYKISNVVEYNEYSSQFMSAALPRNLYASCCAKYGNYVYLFGGYSSGYSYYIFKFDFINGTSSILNEVLPQKLKNACCEIYGDNIYIFGGINNSGSSVNTIYKFNCKTETIETLSTTLPTTLFKACCAIYGDNIYIFGNKSGSGPNPVYKFNCTTETTETLSATLSQHIYGACCSIYKDNIYIFGGKSGSSIQSSIYKFNCLTETISTLTVSLLYPMYDGCCKCYDNIIYILGGYDDFKTYNKISKFNCDNETIESSARVLPYTLKESSCAMHGNKIYTFGGYVNGNSERIMLELTIRIRLPSNTALIYNANGKYNFDLIPDQLTIPIKSVYIGNSDGNAQLANAYIYKGNNWYNVNTGEVLT